MGYWILKSEPEAFSINDLQRVTVEPWDGIRNYQARNFMRDEMTIGDQGFFYHSNCAEPGIVGILTVESQPYPDPTQFDPHSQYHDPKSDPDQPRWILVDVRFVQKFRRTVTLAEMKREPALEGMRLLQRGNRLSILPVEKSHWAHILEMASSSP